MSNVLKKVNNSLYECTLDENDNMVGEYRTFHTNGRLKQQGFVKDELHHGEFVLYDYCGDLIMHCIYYYGAIILEAEEGKYLTNEDRFEMALKYDSMYWIKDLTNT